ncbi:DUF4142 domain-containing protein [uncultured Chitinophaga sp.]|jgi:Predicted outer membrane protein|uniref:DUF4142 domain-containing protein n=1 Tax=uncultured Chitinophaga sp. TaxID=339340 RepID=UPI00260FDBD2|nr:DUF4142 domain-containing protein [uncultured Chitinophaga sp.]
MSARKLLLAGCLVTNALFFVACSDDDDDISNPAISDRDKNFMITASYGNHSEIDMGATADSVSANGGVSLYGQMMVADHTTAQAELDDIGNAWIVDLPDNPDTVHLRLKQQLLTLSGYSFDTAYINAQIRDHNVNIALFEDAAANSDQQRLKDYANKYLPKLRMHLQMADSIAATLNP